MKITKRVYTSIMAMLLVFTLSVASTTTVSAAYRTKKVTATKKMTVGLNVGRTGSSNEITFSFTGLPSNAVISALRINPGSLTYSGAVVSQSLTVRNSKTGVSQTIPWLGVPKRDVDADAFVGTKANGTYALSFVATCEAGPIGYPQTNYGWKSYSNSYIEIEYEY